MAYHTMSVPYIPCPYRGQYNQLKLNARKIQLLDHVMKVLERVIEKRVRGKVSISDMQFGFRSGRRTTDAIFIVRQIQERLLEKKKRSVDGFR